MPDTERAGGRTAFAAHCPKQKNDQIRLYSKGLVISLHQRFKMMSSTEQKKIQDIASKLLKESRSKDQILQTLKNAGIVDKSGEIKSPYNQVLTKK